MKVTNLEDALYHALLDLLSAEKQFRDALKKLAKAATDDALSQAFDNHREETIEHIDRLEQCMEILGRPVKSQKCKAAAGLTDEGADVIEIKGQDWARDILLTTAGRKTEHYEIASYTDAAQWARELGQDKIASLLETTLEEEREADETLHAIAAKLNKNVPVGT